MFVKKEFIKDLDNAMRRKCRGLKRELNFFGGNSNRSKISFTYRVGRKKDSVKFDNSPESSSTFPVVESDQKQCFNPKLDQNNTFAVVKILTLRGLKILTK